MRIAEISTLSRPVPPTGEGSVESLVSLITEGLVRRGHEVTLFALPASRTAANLQSPVLTSYVEDPHMWDWQLYENYQVREAFKEWRKFDLIHCHSYHFGLLYCDFVPVPSLHSFHTEPGPDYRFLAEGTKNRHLHFCSQYQARDFTSMSGVNVVPHGLDASHYHSASRTERENYLAFLGRFIPGKGPEKAIALARQTGVPLKLAGPSNEYFREVIQPQLQHGLVEYVGEVKGAQKADFLSRAQALIYPVQDGEPFGLVLIEALLSGTPVIALDKGAVAEIVDHGVTGWIGQNEEDLVRGLQAVSYFDHDAIREAAVRRFSHECMVDGLEKLMQRIHSGGTP